MLEWNTNSPVATGNKRNRYVSRLRKQCDNLLHIFYRNMSNPLNMVKKYSLYVNASILTLHTGLVSC